MNTHILPFHSHADSISHFAVARNVWERHWLNFEGQWRRWLVRCAMRGGDTLKRALDIVGSVGFLVVFSPIYALLALLIKLHDGGPIFFSQTRVGRYGKTFQMYKFRSMRLDAEAEFQKLLAQNQHAEGITFKMKNDPRVTKIGRVLRRYSLDELPQFLNVIKGEMSLVGPRPPVPREVALYSLADRRRLAVKPGLTCFWQVSGRSNIDFSGQVKLDVRYIETAGFWVDVKILAKTVSAVMAGDGAA
jgi:lipopolysaccharide/colanic/teichoic acid biosynthesis glycosyltransferase